MIKIAVYGKGGIGKSTTVSNLAAALSEKGLRVMQIGCDPKADSTTLLTHGVKMQTALGLMRERNNDFALSDMAKEGFGGVICVEAGGPTPGLGCAGRPPQLLPLHLLPLRLLLLHPHPLLRPRPPLLQPVRLSRPRCLATF